MLAPKSMAAPKRMAAPGGMAAAKSAPRVMAFGAPPK